MIKIHYAIQYNRNFRYLKEIDEIILPYEEKGNNLISFIEETFDKKQRIIIDIIKEIKNFDKIISEINMLIYNGWNIFLKFPVYYTEAIKEVKNNNIPFFFANHATTIEEVFIYAKLGASDIYIVESLGFKIKEVKELANNMKIKIRVYPNIAQCASEGNNLISGIKKFFIRPEDTETYEPYIDTFELLGGEDGSRLSVIYEIYKGEQWLGDLGDLILDLNEKVPNKGINPHFGEMRLNCGKKCLLNKCQICEQTSILAQKFNEVGIEIVKKRKIEPKTEEQKQEIMNRLRRAEDGSGPDEETVHPE